MYSHLLLRALHFFGVIFWVGGIVSLATATAVSTSGRESAIAARQVIARIVTPAMLAAWAGGLGMLIPVFRDAYARAGWMHGKLLLVLVITGLTGALTGALRRAATGDAEVPVARLRALAFTILGLATGVVLLAVLKPGS